MTEIRSIAMEELNQHIARIRADFPFFRKQDADPKGWVYLDNAATTQKPQSVLDAMMDYYTSYPANIHRGLYDLSEQATQAFEQARQKVANLLGVEDVGEVVFTRGTTESLNLLASCWGGENLNAGDEILMTDLEHHANIVPWQMVAGRTGASLVHAPIDDNGNLDVEYMLKRLRSGRVKVMSLLHVSNALGVRNPVEVLLSEARANGVFSVLDAAQSVAHFPLKVDELGCDALVFSGHKLFGPTGIGILWARCPVLESMPPYQGGGDMIKKVSFNGTTFAAPPSRFEAGTPHIAGAIGLGAAVDYVMQVGFETIERIDTALFERAVECIGSIPGVRRVGKGEHQLGVVSFLAESAHPSDLANFLNLDRIAVRTGHHCAQPLMDRLGISGTVRVSFSMYNTFADLERLEQSLRKTLKLLG